MGPWEFQGAEKTGRKRVGTGRNGGGVATSLLPQGRNFGVDPDLYSTLVLKNEANNVKTYYILYKSFFFA